MASTLKSTTFVWTDVDLDRRRLLQLAGSVGATLALAGCSGDGTEGGGDASDDGSGDGSSPDDGSDETAEPTPDTLGEESWTQYGFDGGNTGHAPANAAPAGKPAVLWRVGTAGPVETSPVRAEGTVYISGGNGVLYALDEVDGTEAWTYEAGSSLRTPAVVGGTVYVTTADGYVYAVDADGGTKQWEYRVGVPLHPPTVAHGTVYTGGEPGAVYALSAADGSESWVYRIGEPITAPIAATGDRLIAGTASGTGPVEPHGTLWALSPEGELAWYDTALNGAVVGIAATDGPCVAGDKHGNVYGCRTKYKSNAAFLWTQQLAGTGNPMPALAEGTAYVSRGQFITAIEVSDGTVQWETAPGAMLETAPAVVGGTAYVGHESGLYALDVSDGSLAWSLENGDAMGPPAIANETIAIGSAASNVAVLESE